MKEKGPAELKTSFFNDTLNMLNQKNVDFNDIIRRGGSRKFEKGGHSMSATMVGRRKKV